MITVEAREYDEALEAIDIDEAIEDAAKGCGRYISIEWGVNKPYSDLFGEEDYEWIPYGEAVITLKELNISIDEVLCKLGEYL